MTGNLQLQAGLNLDQNQPILVPVVTRDDRPLGIFQRIQKGAARFGEALVDEFQCFGRDLSYSPNVRNLVHVFNSVVSYLPFTRTATATPAPTDAGATPELTGSALLRNRIQDLPDTIATEDTPVPLSNPEELRALSLLKRCNDDRHFPVSQEAFSAIFSGRPDSSHRDVITLLEHLGRFFGPSRSQQVAFGAASVRKQGFTAFINEHKGSAPAAANEALQAKAESLVTSVQNLGNGRSLVHFGEVAREGMTDLPPYLDDFLKARLPETMHVMLDGDTDAFLYTCKTRIEEQVRAFSADSGVPVDRLKGMLEGAIGRCDAALERVLPTTWYDAVVHSLQEDMRELAVGRRSPADHQRFAERVWDRMMEEGLEKIIHDHLRDTVDRGKALLQDKVVDLQDTIGSHLHSNGMQFLAAAGFKVGQSETFWLEMQRQDNGNFTVKVFCRNLESEVHASGGGHHHFPLVFEDVSVDKLDRSFFLRLLSFEAWPKWRRGMSFTLNDLMETLTEQFEVSAQQVTARTYLPSSLSKGGSTWCWLKRYLYHRGDHRPGDYEKLVHYDIPLVTLINFWPQIAANPSLINKHRRALREQVTTLSSVGLKLYEAGRIDYEEVKRLYATIWEIEEAIKPPANPLGAEGGYDSEIIPPKLQAHLKHFCRSAGVGPQHFTLLKDSAVAVFGREVLEPLEIVLNDLLPELSAPTAPPRLNREPTWAETFRIPTIQKYIRELSQMRPSLLNLFRLWMMASRAISWSVRFSISTGILDATLRAMFPAITRVPHISSRRIAQLALLFGPPILRKLLPESIFRTVSGIIGTYVEVINFVTRRIMLGVLSITTKLILSDEEISAMRHQAISWQQLSTKKGRLDLRTPTSPRVSAEITLPRGTAAADDGAALSESDELTAAANLMRSRSMLPRPHSVTLTAANALTTIQSWTARARTLASDQGLSRSEQERKRQVAVYLNNQLRDLPVPGGQGGELWDQVDDPRTLLEHLSKLMDTLHSSSVQSRSQHEFSEHLISSHSIFAIMDRLARRCPEAYIPNSAKPSGSELAFWMRRPCIKLVSHRSHRKLTELARYFQLPLLEDCSKSKWQSYRASTLLGMEGGMIQVGQTHQVPDIQRRPKHFTYTIQSALRPSCQTEAYYHSLLQKDSIKRKLAVHGITDGSPFLDRLSTVFRDPTVGEARSAVWRQRHAARLAAGDSITLNPTELAQIRAMGQTEFAGSHPMDNRQGLLPRPFYLLRRAYLQIESYEHGRTAELATQDLSIHAAEYKEWMWGWARACTNKVHAAFKQYTNSRVLQSPYPLTSFQYFHGRQNPYRLPGQSLPRGCAVSVRAGSWHIKGALKLITEASKKTQSELMLKPNPDRLRFRKLTPVKYYGDSKPTPPDFSEFKKLQLSDEEARLLEMLNTHPSDQVARCLSFFTNARERLADTTFQFLFDMLVTDLGPLTQQLEQRPQFAEDIGRFFADSLEFFQRREDWHTYLFLCKLGQEMMVQCKLYYPDAPEVFPNFRNCIRETVEPVYRGQSLEERQKNGLIDPLAACYLYQLSSFLESDPRNLTAGEIRELLTYLGRYSFAQFERTESLELATQTYRASSVLLEAKEVAFRWRPMLLAALEQDPAFRKEVLDGVLRDRGLTAGGDWSGDFPVYENNFYQIDLSKKVSIKDRASMTTVLDAVQDQLGYAIADAAFVGHNTVSYAAHGCTAELRNGQVSIYREIGGKRYRLLYQTGTICRPRKDEKLWVEEDSANPDFLLMRDSIIVRRIHTRAVRLTATTRTFRVTGSEQAVGESTFESVDLASTEHGLSLLGWFQPLEDTRALIERQATGDVLKRIEFPKLDLGFELREQAGEKRAYNSDGTAPGFYISKVQRDTRLEKYGKSLLLRNDKGEEKLLVLRQPMEQILSNFVLNNLAEAELSPVIQKTIHELLQATLERPEQFYTFSVDSEGKLRSFDPEAMLYLVFQQLALGNKKEALHYFSVLENWGRSNPFPEKCFRLFNELLGPLMFCKEPSLSLMALRLAAIREENILIHQNAKVPTDELDHLRWVAVQYKYQKYLQEVADGAPARLSKEEELFLLQGIGNHCVAVIQDQVKDLLRDGDVADIIEKVGIETLSRHLMMVPAIAKRYRLLRNCDEKDSFLTRILECTISDQLETESSSSSSSAGQSNPFSAQRPALKSPGFLRASLIQRIVKLFREKMQEKKRGDETLKSILSQNLWTMDLEDLPTEFHQLTPKLITQNFLHYYRLIANALPAGWEHNDEKRQLFERKHLACVASLRLLRGEVKDPLQSSCVAALKAIATDTGSLSGLPTPQQLEVGYVRGQRVRRYEAQIQALNKVIYAEDASETKKARYRAIRERLHLRMRAQNFTDGRQPSAPIDRFESYIKTIMGTIPKASFMPVAKDLAFTAALRGVAGVSQSMDRDAQAKAVLQRFLAPARMVLDGGKVLYRGHQLVRRLDQAVVQENLRRARAAKVDREKSLSEVFSGDFAALLQQQEQRINGVMDGLIEYYFDRVDLPPSEETPVDSYPETDSEAAVRKGFAQLNQSLTDYYDRPQAGGYSYHLKAGRDVATLGKDLVQLREKVSARLAKEKAYIERYANHNFQFEETEKQAVLRRLKRQSLPQKEALSFDEIDDLFMQDRDSELLGRSEMGAEELKHLKEHLYLYHVMASRWNLLFDRIKDLKEPSDAALQSLGGELSRRRVYGFNDIPERLLRGKLVFESRSRRMLWTKQSQQIDRLLGSDHHRVVVELIMGSGKTWYGIPQTDYFSADGEQLMINVWPAAVAPTNIATIGEQSKDILAQAVNSMSFSRLQEWTAEKLWGLAKVFDRTRLERQQMNVTKESLQSFELCFIEQAMEFKKAQLDGREPAKLRRALVFFGDVLRSIRQWGKGCIDETHVAFARKKELNHPLGKPKEIPKKYLPVMEDALFLLVNSDEFREYLTVKADKPSPLDRRVYDERILPVLARKVAELEGLEVSAENRQAYIAYITGAATEVPDFVKNSKLRGELALAKGLLTVLIPGALEKTIHVDFGASKKGNGQYARPSEGNGNTQEQSTIRSPYEAFVKSGLLLLHDRLTDEQINRFIRYLQKKARVRSTVQGSELENTFEVRFFKQFCPEHDLFDHSAEQLQQIHQLLNRSDRVVLSYLRIFVAPEIRYYENNLSSNSTNFGSMFASFYSDTGTPYNKGCYPTGTAVLTDPGTDGESVDILEKKGSLPNAIQVLEQEAPRNVLTEMIERFFHANRGAKAFIDRGAVFNGLSSNVVAKEILDYIEERRTDLDGVAFYMNGELVIWERGAKGPIPLCQSSIPPERRLSYYPQPQSFAADIPQADGCTGIVSIGEDIQANQLFQAIWRMRGLKRSDQKLVFVMTKRVRKLISEDRTPTIREIIAYAQRNQNEALAEDNFFADSRHKLHNVVRRAILDKVLSAPSLEMAVNILWEFKDIFLGKIQDDPYYLFGLIDVQVEPAAVFATLRERYYKLVKDSKLFSNEEKERLKDELEAIGSGSYPSRVHSYRDSDGIHATRLDDLGMESQIETDSTETTDVEQDVENEMRQELQQRQEQAEVVGRRLREPQRFQKWPESLNPTALGWFRVASLVQQTSSSSSAASSSGGPVPIYSMRDVLLKEGSEDYRAVAHRLSKTIFASNNVMHMRAQTGYPIRPFGTGQIPLQEALVVRSPDSPLPKIILIDQREAEYWRRKLKEDRDGKHRSDPHVKIGIYDIGMRALVAEGRNRFEADELRRCGLFQRAIVQLKILRGDVRYARDQEDLLRAYMRANPRVMPYFKRVYAKHGKRPFEGSVLERIAFETAAIPQHQITRI